MKKCALFCIFSIIISIIVTSCLGESGQTISVVDQMGVVRESGDSTYVYIRGNERVYSSGFGNEVDNDDCILFSYNIDFSSAENKDSGRIKGFRTADITRYTPIPRHNLLMTLSDTSARLDNEITVSSYQKRNALILNNFFFTTEHVQDSLPLLFNLSCNPEQAKVNASGNKVYDLFLRVAKNMEADSALQDKVQFNAYNLDELVRREQDSLIFQINYVSSFNKDSTAINWAKTDIYSYSLK